MNHNRYPSSCKSLRKKWRTNLIRTILLKQWGEQHAPTVHPKNVHPRLSHLHQPQFVPYSLFKIVLLYIGGWVKVKHFHNNTLIITPSIWGSIKNIRIAPIKVAHCKKIELWDTLEQYGLQIGVSLRVYNIYTYMPQNIYMTPCKFNKLGHVCACLHLHT
jgi:hypothetical protein